ncbi:hypothetical protein SDC9_140092 [bioreactor metagenome]|uniref:Uncharacterized protein n=1 Tax=bioreactor metagenome TaxID=1076179 RepID=A0A645DUC7_9ZZZZ
MPSVEILILRSLTIFETISVAGFTFFSISRAEATYLSLVSRIFRRDSSTILGSTSSESSSEIKETASIRSSNVVERTSRISPSQCCFTVSR